MTASQKQLRLLIIEDSEADAILLTRKIKEAGYAPSAERVDTLEALQTALGEQNWDILICDHSLPQLSALKALELLRQRDMDLPILIVSGTIPPESAVACMKAGASDYIMKDDMTRLVPVIERELREAKERKARRKAEEQFRQAQKMESIGRLAGGIAHDFNNLLTAILGYCTFLLQNLPADDPNARDVKEIQNAAEKAALLTRQLLTFSRKQLFQMKILDLNAVIAPMQKLLQRLIGEDIELALALEKELGHVKADSGQMEQLLMNLCVNARDAMPEGGKLTIATANVTLGQAQWSENFEVASGPYVLLSITDTGCGMSKEILAHMFEPFFTTKEPGKGTGLGLSTVYGIVKQFNGYIWVDSEPGKGTSFKIYLPQVDEPAQDHFPSDTIKTQSLQGQETVLLVEDDERVRSLTRRMLAKQGYKVLEAQDAQDALKICKNTPSPIHLMVTDVVMPHMSGSELGKYIESLCPNLKILYLSGHAENIIADKGVLRAGVHFLQKPFNPLTLAQKVREVLDSKL